MASRSRWLVGSSSSSRSGCATSARARSTRRRQPPDNVSTLASGGKVEVRQDQLDALFDAPSVVQLELVLQLPELREQRRRAGVGHAVRRVVVARHQFAQLAEPVGDDVDNRAIGRERNVLREPGDAQSRLNHTEPRSGRCSPLRICNSVDFPVPFRPTSDTRSPASIWSTASSSNGRCPNESET